ncbi:MAG: SHOCT domain-containing protein [Campylobacterota bacterium]|nr:SHOCT domain-containing protein [Campylobacterota bacterium]
MKNIQKLLLIVVLILLSACGSKTPFKVQEPLENAALVYIYAPDNINSSDGSDYSNSYSIRIDNKRYMQRVMQGEYVALNLKPELIKISVTIKAVQEKAIKLDLKSTNRYYLKITDDIGGGDFTFEEMDETIALKEISTTELAGSYEKSKDDIISSLIDSDDNESEVKETKRVEVPQENSAKIDEIQKAYEMKEKGIISEDEFQALKMDILKK